MSTTKEKLEQAKKDLDQAGRAKGKAQADYDLALTKVKDLQRRLYYEEREGPVTTKKTLADEEDTTTTKTSDTPSKPPKTDTPSKPPKPKASTSEDKPDKPSKPSKPTAPPKPKAQEESSGDIAFDEYSSDMLARDAKDKIRDLTDEENAEEKIFTFIKGGEEPEDRTTVLGVAETHIGKELVDKVRNLEEKELEDQEEPEEKEDDVDETIDELTDEEEKEESEEPDGDLRVELPEGIDRPEGAPECFGNEDVYDQDSHKCMVCVFDFECEKAQEAIAEA